MSLFDNYSVSGEKIFVLVFPDKKDDKGLPYLTLFKNRSTAVEFGKNAIKDGYTNHFHVLDGNIVEKI